MYGEARVTAEEQDFHGEPAIALDAGGVSAAFLTQLGMTGVSLRYRDREYLATPGGVHALRSGHTIGLPLLAPWANRLGGLTYEAAGARVDLRRLPLHTDGNGLPIHGLLVGAEGWRVDDLSSTTDRASLHASITVDAPAFPFPHRIEITATVRDAQVTVDTSVVPTGDRAVPVAFGWHPYLQLPGTPRTEWTLDLPAREHLALDARGIPTGASAGEAREAAPIARRTFDDLYSIPTDQVLALRAPDGAAIELHRDAGYPFAQVWAPPEREFAALEPMTVPTNALGTGATPLVAPGEVFRATFALVLRAARA
jgi:galactose mutarotase-like enzyme